MKVNTLGQKVANVKLLPLCLCSHGVGSNWFQSKSRDKIGLLFTRILEPSPFWHWSFPKWVWYRVNTYTRCFCCYQRNFDIIVAKVPYQEQQWREVAVKARDVFKRCRRSEALSGWGNEPWNWRLEWHFWKSQRMCTRSRRSDAPPSDRLRIQGNRSRRLRFMTDEDDFLRNGIWKHRPGQ